MVSYGLDSIFAEHSFRDLEALSRHSTTALGTESCLRCETTQRTICRKSVKRSLIYSVLCLPKVEAASLARVLARSLGFCFGVRLPKVAMSILVFSASSEKS